MTSLVAVLCASILSVPVSCKVSGLRQRQSGAHSLNPPSEFVSNAADFLLDAKMQVDQIDQLETEVKALLPDLAAGGDKPRVALLRLIALANEPNAKWV